jgi:hypothetical protein
MMPDGNGDAEPASALKTQSNTEPRSGNSGLNFLCAVMPSTLFCLSVGLLRRDF